MTPSPRRSDAELLDGLDALLRVGVAHGLYKGMKGGSMVAVRTPVVPDWINEQGIEIVCEAQPDLRSLIGAVLDDWAQHKTRTFQ